MKLRRIIKWSLLTLSILFVLSVGAAWYLLDYSLTPGGSRGQDIEKAWKETIQAYPELKEWRDSLAHLQSLHDTTLRAEDGTELHAFFIRAARPTRHTAILVHGYTDNAIRMMPLGYMYERSLGYNILLPDLRFAGTSGGDHIQMGWKDRKDLTRWLQAVPSMFGDTAAVVVHGISMGAATTMMLSGEKDVPLVRAYVEDCGYSSVWEQFHKELGERFHLPSFPLMNIASRLCRLRYGWDFKEASALRQVERCKKPMFFIHGSADKFVPTRMVYELYRAKPAPKKLWVVPESGHAKSFHDYKKEYTQHIRNFLTPLM